MIQKRFLNHISRHWEQGKKQMKQRGNSGLLLRTRWTWQVYFQMVSLRIIDRQAINWAEWVGWFYLWMLCNMSWMFNCDISERLDVLRRLLHTWHLRPCWQQSVAKLFSQWAHGDWECTEKEKRRRQNTSLCACLKLIILWFSFIVVLFIFQLSFYFVCFRVTFS